MKVRIGIDVGGTFTDGVAIDGESYEIIGKVKVPTTHSAKEGVARGIIEVFQKLIDQYEIDPEDIIFLAHGTTQATNALLEGDVSPVGIVGTGSGLEGMKAKRDTNIDEIEVANGKYIRTYHIYIDNNNLDLEIENVINRLKEEGAEVIVGAEPYSVDNPRNENTIVEMASEMGLSAAATNQISKLYGLKVRTRTTVINASILPRMIETADMTIDSVKKTGIEAPLMIMRGDGGVMNVEEMKKRPILTLLSGPAAGVAGALMYEKVSDGIFLEVGGTSTDISVIKNGEVMIKYAEIENHETYVNSLDVHTVGIAGGSMVQLEGNKIGDVGPRSAHIAGLPYAVFAEEEIINSRLIEVKPKEEDPENYLAVETENGDRYALTLTGAANILGKIPDDSYSRGNYEAAYKAFEPLADKIDKSVEETAEIIMEKAVKKAEDVVEEFIEEYELDTNIIELVGGGGGAGVILPYLAEEMDIKFKLAKNSEVISTIGVSLAMLREVVERTIINPDEEDILKLRKEAEDAILKSGANEETVEVKMEIDRENNTVRAIASGTTEMRQKEFNSKNLKLDDLKEIAAESMEVASENVTKRGATNNLTALGTEKEKKKLWGLIKSTINPLRIVDGSGVIKTKIGDGEVVQTTFKNAVRVLKREMEERIQYKDGGAEIPNIFIACGSRIVDLTGLVKRDQIISMAKAELQGYEDEEDVFIVFASRGS